MENIIITNQKEYDDYIKEVIKPPPYFDIEMQKGNDIVEEVNAVLYGYLYHDRGKGDAENDLSRFYFTQEQATSIVNYFSLSHPSDLFDIERGLNELRIYPVDSDYFEGKKVVIKDASETINVHTPVEVIGDSIVNVFKGPYIIARDYAIINAKENAFIEAHNYSQVDGFINSRIMALDNTHIHAHEATRVNAYNDSYVISTENSHVRCYDQVSVDAHDNSKILAFNNSKVNGNENAVISAFDKTEIKARDNSQITAHNTAKITARNSSKVNAQDHSLVYAEDNSVISSYGNSCVLTKDSTHVAIQENGALIIGHENNADNLRKNIFKVMKHPLAANNPMEAVKIIIQGAPDSYRQGISRRLITLGCTNERNTNEVITAWITPKHTYKKSKETESVSWDR
jgi:hypothetical protein